MKLYRSQPIAKLCTWCRQATAVACTICGAPVCGDHRVDSHWCTNCVAEYNQRKRVWLPHSIGLILFMLRKRGTGAQS